jgi:hypothetical protein
VDAPRRSRWMESRRVRAEGRATPLLVMQSTCSSARTADDDRAKGEVANGGDAAAFGAAHWPWRVLSITPIQFQVSSLVAANA